jgi:uncharacterized protein YdhG (YjbR/CyaY superfamily)
LQDSQVDSKAATIDAYIAASPRAAQPALRRIREIFRGAAPDAKETISYRMPAFRSHGILVYFAGLQDPHRNIPPIEGDVRLDEALARYRGPKGNLRFPLDETMPYGLIERIALINNSRGAVSTVLRRRLGSGSARLVAIEHDPPRQETAPSRRL